METLRMHVTIPRNRRLRLDVDVPDRVAPGDADVTVTIEPDGGHAADTTQPGKRLADFSGLLKDRNPHPERKVSVEDMNAAIARRLRSRERSK